MKKILFLKIGAFGDVIMAMTAVHRLLRSKEKEVEVTWICGESVAPLIRKILPEVELLTVNEAKLFKHGLSSSILEVIKVNFRLGFQSVDRLAIGYRDPKYRFLSFPVRSHNQISFPDKPGIYHAHLYFEMLGGRLSELTESPLSPSDLISTRAPGYGLVLAPGGARNFLREEWLRRYPVEHYATLAKTSLDRGIPVTIMGGPEDDWIRPYFQDLPVKWELGSVCLEELPYWLQQFETLITHDSGPMHFGFMAGLKVTALFGPTRAEEKVPQQFQSLGIQIIQGGKQLSCAPCYDGKTYADCSHQKCLSDISPNLDQFLNLS